MARSGSKHPTDGELAILKLLWEQGPSRLSVLCENLDEERGSAPSTVATILRIMKDKGLVERLSSGAGVLWQAKLTQKKAGSDMLQSLTTQRTYLVTLNNTDAVDPNRILKRLSYDHPVYTTAGVAAQSRQAEINGVNRTYFCGAYWRYGFHEDGVVSALNALRHFKEKDHETELSLPRAS